MKLYTAVVLSGIGVGALQSETLDVKLGLWEVTYVTQSSGMPMVDMSRFSPEQRAQMEAALKKSQAKPQTKTQKSCLTKEQLEKSYYFLDRKPSCKVNVVSTARTASIKEQCSGDEAFTMDATFEAMSRENVKGTMRMTMSDRGSSMTQNSTFTAKWLGPVCGDVK
jgi:hypothetical protein